MKDFISEACQRLGRPESVFVGTRASPKRLYIVENWLVDGFSNITGGSLTSPLLYWGFNPLWAFGSGLASFYSFRFVLRTAEAKADAAVG